MTAELLSLAAQHDLVISDRWTGWVRIWTVRNSDGVFLFSTDCYDNLIKRLNEGTGLRIGDYPPKWWPI